MWAWGLASFFSLPSPWRPPPLSLRAQHPMRTPMHSHILSIVTNESRVPRPTPRPTFRLDPVATTDTHRYAGATCWTQVGSARRRLPSPLQQVHLLKSEAGGTLPSPERSEGLFHAGHRDAAIQRDSWSLRARRCESRDHRGAAAHQPGRSGVGASWFQGFPCPSCWPELMLSHRQGLWCGRRPEGGRSRLREKKAALSFPEGDPV